MSSATSLAFQQLTQVMDEQEYTYQQRGDEETITADFKTQVAAYHIVMKVEAEFEMFQIFGYAPVVMPEGSRRAIAEAVARANYGLRIGKFELDMNDGELRYHIAHILTEGNLDPVVADRCIDTTMAMLDRYFPAMLSVAFGNEPAEEAIMFAECGPRCTESDEDGDSDGDEDDSDISAELEALLSADEEDDDDDEDGEEEDEPADDMDASADAKALLEHQSPQPSDAEDAPADDVRPSE